MVEFSLFWFTGVRLKKLERFFVINFDYTSKLWIDRGTTIMIGDYERIVAVSIHFITMNPFLSMFSNILKSSSLEVPCKGDALKNLTKFTGEHLS